VDIRVRGSESEVESPRQCCLHILSGHQSRLRSDQDLTILLLLHGHKNKMQICVADNIMEKCCMS